MTTTATAEAPVAAAPAMLTLKEVESRICGAIVTWENLIALINEAIDVQVTFGLRRDDNWSEASLPVTKEAALHRATNGIRWAREKDQEQRVRVTACAGALWFGSKG